MLFSSSTLPQVSLTKISLLYYLGSAVWHMCRLKISLLYYRGSAVWHMCRRKISLLYYRGSEVWHMCRLKISLFYYRGSAVWHMCRLLQMENRKRGFRSNRDSGECLIFFSLLLSLDGTISTTISFTKCLWTRFRRRHNNFHIVFFTGFISSFMFISPYIRRFRAQADWMCRELLRNSY
jgi:hypothetical protein